MSNLIEIVDYRPEWPSHYQNLAEKIRAIAPAASRLHHIGSTAVPNLAAKDIIDMQLTVNSLSDVDAARFSELGFIERTGLSDHLPPDIQVPPQELAKRFFRSSGRPANLHVRQRGRFNQRYALVCRDYLRSHSAAASAYAIIKLRLAERFPTDVDAYYDIKDPVFDVIMAGANDWAAASGWQEPGAD